MFEAVNRTAVVTRIAVTGVVLGVFSRVKRTDRGQGAVEYVGIILVVAAIILALVAFGPAIGAAIGGKITEAVDSIGG